MEKKDYKSYFLGLMSVEDAETLELQIISGDETEAELLRAENNLIEDYLNKNLTNEETQAFNTNFLITKERRKRVEFVKLIRDFAQSPATPAADTKEIKPGIFEQIKSFLNPRKFAVGFGGLALILIIGFISYLGWKNLSNDSGKSEISVLLNKSFKNSRPTEARITGFDYAPKIEGTRGNDDKTQDLNFVSAKSRATEAVLKNETAENLHALGRVYLAERNFDEAIKQFEKALKKSPNIAQTHNDLGVALLEKGKLYKSNEEGNKKLDEKTDETKSYLEFFTKANEEFAKAVELDKNLTEAYFNKALCIEFLNLPNQAKEAWENYLKLDANSKWADEARTHLKTLEENKPISRTKEEILQDFFEAEQANDREKAWQILSRNRGLSSGKLLPQQLAFLFIDSKTIGDEANAQKALDALLYTGKLEEEKSGDLFWRDLAEYYLNVSENNIPKLKQAKDRYFITVLDKESSINEGEYKESIIELKEAQKLYRQANNILEPKLIDFLLGYLINRDVKILESNEKLKELAEFSKKSGYKWLETQAVTWLAANDLSERKFSQSLSKIKTALALSKETDDLLNQQKIFSQFSDIYFLTGQFEKSFSNIQQNLELGNLPGASLTERWRSLNSISRYLFKLKRLNSTIDFEKEAFALANELGNKTFQFTSSVDLGVTYSALEDFDNALNLIEKGQAISETFSDVDYKNKCVAYTDLQLGHLKRQQRLYSEAIEYYQKASNYYESDDFQVDNYEAHRGVLLSSLADKNDVEIRAELPKIFAIFKTHRQEILEEQSRNSFFDNEQDVYDIAADYEFGKTNFAKAFDYAEESRSRSLLDLQNSAARVLIDEKQPEIKFSAKLSEPLKLTQIQAEMAENTQLLVYTVLPEKVLIWLVGKDSLDTAKIEISSEELQEKVTSYLELVSKNEDPNQQQNLSKEIYRVLISPIKDKLDANKQLFIIPDKLLFRLPFVSLYNEKYLLEEYEISYSPSANVFLNCSRKAKEFNGKKAETLLSIGNPTFNRAEYEADLQPLPSAKKEAEEIAEEYERSLVLTEKFATKEKVKANLKKADVVHFAGHYVIEEGTPLLSSFILAGDKKEESNLANYEIIGEKLSNTRLIVLSACDTEIEKYYKGEGVIGASRTFLATNIPLVVASQWSVDSEATKELMIRFHQLRKTEKISTAEALRQSQLEMLKNETFKNPYYWSAFVTLGGYTQF